MMLCRYQYLIRHKDGMNKGMYYKCSECIERVFITKGLIDHYADMHRSEVPDIDLKPLITKNEASDNENAFSKPLKSQPVKQKSSRQSITSQYNES